MRSPVRVLAAAAFAMCALAFLLAKTKLDGTGERDRYASLLLELQKVDSALDEELLAARHGHLLNYDPIAKNVHDLQAGAARLKALPALARGAGARRMADGVARLLGAVEEKGALVERFEAENSTWRNSLAFFPVAASELADEVDGRDHALALQVQHLLRDVLVYNLQSNDEMLPRVQAGLDALAARARAGSRAPWKAGLDRVLAHGRAIVERKTVLDAVTRDALALPIRAALLDIQATHREQSREQVSATNDYRLVLYLFAIALLAAIAYSYLRLENTTFALNRANATLEKRVEERTRELERATRELGDREEELALAQELSHTGSWAYEPGGARFSRSPELARLLGLDEAAPFSTELFLARVHPDDRGAVAAALDRVLGGEGVYDAEHRIVCGDGACRWVHARAQVLAGGAGAPYKVIGTLQDVTERKEIQTKLMHAERMASLGTLAGGVAHEINNPLSYVLSNVAYVTRALADVEERVPAAWLADARQVLHEARDGAERVKRIVQDLHAFTRPGDRTALVDVHEVLDLAVNIASSEIRYRATLVKEYGDVPRVCADASRLGQVALNLLVNAAQAIPEGRPSENVVRVATRADDRGRVVIEVSDTGSGIAPEVRGHLFEPFVTTKPVGKGTGLGLSICHGIVASLGGEIAVESAVGQGTTFRVCIPAAPAAALARDPAPSRARGRHASA